MDSYYTYVLLVFTSFFTLINPLGSAPVFTGMTTGLQPAQKKTIARKAVFIAFCTLVLFAISGQIIFKIFGISVDSFRMVGGIIFFIVGYDMLQARLGGTKTSKEEQELNAYVDDISVTPLAIPIICGPGAISNAIVLMEDAHNLIMKILLIVTIAAILLLTYFIHVQGAKIMQYIGETGNKVMMRIMGLIVMVIAVEFFFSGLKPILIDIIQAATL